MNTTESNRIKSQLAGVGDCSNQLLDSLLMVARLESRFSSEAAITSGLPIQGRELPPELFVRAANRAGLAATFQERALSEIPNEVLPAILLLKDGKSLVLTELDYSQNIAVSHSVAEGETRQIDLQSLEQIYSGNVFYVRPMQSFDARTPKIYQDTDEHWFWGVLKSASKIYRDVLLASFLINLFVLAQPLFVMNVYDRVVPNNAFETLWALAIGVVLVYLFDWGLKNLRAYFVEMAAKRTDVILSAQLFERVMNLKLWFKPVSTGAFATRLQDFDMLRNFVTSTSILVLIDLPFLLLFLLFIFYLGGWLVLIPLTAIPFALLIAWQTQKKLKPMIENVMRSASKKNATLVESLVGTEAIKALGCEGQMQKEWEQAVGYMSQWGLKSRTTSNFSLTAVQFIQNLSMVGIVVAGVYSIAAKDLTMGGLIACVLLNGRALASLGQMAGLLTNFNHALATLKSLTGLMETPLERERGRSYLHRPQFQGSLEFKNVSFSYPDQPFPALNSATFRITPGEKVAVIGKIGSGKSTLAKMALRFYDPAHGSILADGFDLQQVDVADIRSNIFYLGQEITLFYGTVRDNIAFGAGNVEDSEVISAAERAGIIDFINAHPLGFQMPIGERGQTLSAGQRAAVGLARAFLRMPPIIIMDEPTAAMDQGTELQIKNQIQKHFANSSLLLITHKMVMLDVVDRVLVMDKGTIVADGPKEKVLDALKAGQIRGRV